ncbi:MAG: DUF3267 domain-containing protein [Saprospiraceae bacterium]
MNIQPEELTARGYRQKDSLNHQELIPFVQTYLKKKTFSSRLFNVLNLLFLAFFVAFFSYHYAQDNFSFGDGLSYTGIGVLLALSLIPVHEYLHVLAYRYVGAQQTSYDANLKKFYFMAIADRFVANKKEFFIVALTPFLSVCIAVGISLFVLEGLWICTALSVLVTHTTFCSGDFALLSYFDFHQDREIVTYDDRASGISYFYEK